MLGALMELSTERVNSMGIGSIPVSKIWEYIDRFALPDWWEPVILQADAAIISSANRDTNNGSELQNNTAARGKSTKAK